MTKVEATCNFEYNGVAYVTGEVLEVSEDEAQRLVSIEAVKEAADNVSVTDKAPVATGEVSEPTTDEPADEGEPATEPPLVQPPAAPTTTVVPVTTEPTPAPANPAQPTPEDIARDMSSLENGSSESSES